MKLKFGTAVVLILVTSSLSAQQPPEQWDWKIAPYLWTANFDGTSRIGPVESDIDVSFSDILENLDFGALLRVGADRGKHGFYADVQYLRIEPDPNPAPMGPGEIQTRVELTTAEAAYRHNFSGAPTGSSLLLGARYIDTTITLTRSQLPRAEGSADWVDGFVGYQYMTSLSDRWSSQFQATAGAGGSDLTLTAQLMFTRETGGGNHWAFGARIWDIDYEDTVGPDLPFELDMTMYGLLVGFIFD